MKFKRSRQVSCLAFVCAILLNISASAQTYVRYVVPADIGTKALYSDNVLPSIRLPWGVSRVDDNQTAREAAFELADILRNRDMKLLSVYVCGSASPDGLWQDNVKLSEARTEAAVRYLRYVTGVSVDKISRKSLNEDWDRLYELVEASEIPCRDEVLEIIRTKSWGERKQALKNLAGGKVWRILMDDFFPELRCVRIAFYCLWDPTKPYMSCPDKIVETVAETVEDLDSVDSVEEEACGAPEPEISLKSRVDTVYVRDTIYYMKETVYVPQPVYTPGAYEQTYQTYRTERVKRERKLHDSPWMMGLKTNLIGDAIIVPTFGAEIQLAKKLSLDLQACVTTFNSFNNFDKHTNLYGFSPELRFWPGGGTMRKGQFVGIHARLMWYTLTWKDGLLYQNGPKDVWEGNFHNAGNADPAWSAGLTYGYSLGFGKRGNWGLEFLVGIGYASYSQNVAALNDSGIWELLEHQDKSHFGITRAGINLTYRFSLRKVNPSYYDN